MALAPWRKKFRSIRLYSLITTPPKSSVSIEILTVGTSSWILNNHRLFCYSHSGIGGFFSLEGNNSINVSSWCFSLGGSWFWSSIYPWISWTITDLSSTRTISNKVLMYHTSDDGLLDFLDICCSLASAPIYFLRFSLARLKISSVCLDNVISLKMSFSI